MNSINRNSLCVYQLSQRLVVKTCIYRPQSVSRPSFGEGAMQNILVFLSSWFLAELSSDKPCGVHVKSIHFIEFGQRSTN